MLIAFLLIWSIVCGVVVALGIVAAIMGWVGQLVRGRRQYSPTSAPPPGAAVPRTDADEGRRKWDASWQRCQDQLAIDRLLEETVPRRSRS